MKQTSKEFVLEHKPLAYVKRVDTSRIRGIKDIRYYIFVSNEPSYLAVGSTSAKAWKEAKEILLARENE